MYKMLLSHLLGPKNSVFVRFVVRILLIAMLAVGLSGCDITISSIIVPSTALIGQTITIMLQGNGCDDDPVTNPDGLILQIPVGTEVVSTDGLTPDNTITAGYTAEPGYQLWGGKQSTSNGGGCTGVTKNITLKINATASPGTYYIKAAVRGFVGGAWTNMHPGTTNFADISGAYQSNAIAIAATGIGITSPHGGEFWYAGITHPVSWLYSGNVGSAVDIELYEGSSPIYTVATDFSIGSNGNGAYDWLIPSLVGTGYDYQIKVTSTSNSSYSVLSPFFSILPPYINLADPNGGTIYNGIIYRVVWYYAGLDGTTVNIDLYKGGSFYDSVAAGVDVGSGGNGSYEWTPSAVVGIDYQIKVTSTVSDLINGFSNSYFEIADCPNKKVWMTAGSTQYYDSIQAAYDDNDAAIGSARDIYAQAANFTGGLLLDEEKTVTLHGGWDCGYGTNAGYTTVQGVMTIVGGSVVVDNLIVAL